MHVSAYNHSGKGMKGKGKLGADVSDNSLSLGKLARNGFRIRQSGAIDSVMHDQNDPTTTIPFFVQQHQRPRKMTLTIERDGRRDLLGYSWLEDMGTPQTWNSIGEVESC